MAEYAITEIGYFDWQISMNEALLPHRAFADKRVEAVFSSYPDAQRQSLYQLRGLIFDVAARTDGVGPVLEALRWGQPAYLTAETKSGSTIRLGRPKAGGIAIYTHCQTTILSEFQNIFPDDFVYEGNRAVHFKSGADLPLDKLEMLIRRALTYHL